MIGWAIVILLTLFPLNDREAGAFLFELPLEVFMIDQIRV